MVLGCAKADRGQMARLLEVFAAHEHHVELVSGVDESRQRWREAGQRHGMRAVYVACGGQVLAPSQLVALRQELASLGIPDTSIWAEVVDWAQLDRLIRDVDRMIEQAPPMVPAPPPLASVRTAGPSATPPPAPPSLLPAIGPSVVPAVAEGSIAPMLPPSSPRLAPTAPSRDGSRVSLPPRPDVPSPLGAMEPLDSMDSMDSMVGRVGGWGRRVAWTLGVLAAAGLVGVVTLARPSPTNAESSATITDAAVAAVAAAASQAPAASRTGALAPQAGNEPRLALASAAAERAGAPVGQRSPTSEPVGAADLTAPTAGDDDALVHTALMQRKIRALDILLVSPEATRRIKGRRHARVVHTHWAGAHAHCEALEIDGVAGWRLPTAGEFRTLGTSNMLGRRIYWSATEGDAFGSDRVVWNNQKKRMAPAPSTWKGGRVLCVRFQHPERVLPS